MSFVAVAPKTPRGSRAGIDLVEVSQVAQSIQTFGDRYLQRVFTPHELASAIGDDAVRAARLAARFAAKEAVVKILRPEAKWTDWRSIEVIRAPDGHCSLALHGDASRLADRARIRALSVSLTHEGELAAAVVVAELGAKTNRAGRGRPVRRRLASPARTLAHKTASKARGSAHGVSR